MLVKIGPFDEAEIRAGPCSSSSSTFVPVMSEGIRSGVNWIRLNCDVEDPGQRADHQRLGQARHADQQAVAAGEDGGEDLLDHLVLADDDLLQFLLHQPAVLAELLQDVAEVSGFGVDIGANRGSGSGVGDAGFAAADGFARLQWYHSISCRRNHPGPAGWLPT